MSNDFFVRLGANKTASGLVRTLHLPVPMPQLLERSTSPRDATPLQGRAVIVGGAPGGVLTSLAVDTAAKIGAEAWRIVPPGEAAFATRDPRTVPIDALPDRLRPHGLVFDATGIATPQQLDALYDFFHPQVRSLRPCGRVVVLARPVAEAPTPEARAAAHALDGFVRSLAKEIGRKGATANLLRVDSGAEQWAPAALRFFLSQRSAYVSGQPLHVSAQVAHTPNQEYVQALTGKVALVTGAARGIGEATARALAREGARVIVMDRPAELAAAQAVAEEIGGTALACDVTDPEAAAIVRSHVNTSHGGLDIVVHNAGITRDKMHANMDAARWGLVLDVNLRCLIALNEGLLPELREGGRVVCLSSIGGIAGNVGQTNYAATKAGVIGYIQALAPTVAARGITVNAIAPGFIETPMTAAIPFATREVARRLCNLAQGGQPEDIAETIAFLAMPDAAGITGEVLRVCGGNFIGA